MSKNVLVKKLIPNPLTSVMAKPPLWHTSLIVVDACRGSETVILSVGSLQINFTGYNLEGDCRPKNSLILPMTVEDQQPMTMSLFSATALIQL